VPIEKPLDHERLTPRESEVLTYLSKGFTIKEIASLMGIKWFTVNDHIKSIYKKLNVSSRAEAAVLASKQGWCESGQALVLRVAQRGQRLFTQEDARLAERVGDLLQRAVAYDQAVERGRHEERQRIAEDLHDDIGARSLTLMYQARTPEMENYIRHTLQDLKTLARGLVSNALAHGRANRIEAQLRFAADGWLLRMADDGEGQAPQA
jgi:DNA-binding CsgD family transcriptional regulator/glucose-6-phosphate-specific signal transduction histidine kinase